MSREDLVLRLSRLALVPDFREGEKYLKLAIATLLKYGMSLDDIVKYIQPFKILFQDENETFYNPKSNRIHPFVESFQYLFEQDTLNPLTIEMLFTVKKIIPVASTNARVLILETRTPVKRLFTLKYSVYPERVDSPSLEYYTGLIINTLRESRIPCFGLTYGRFACVAPNARALALLGEMKLCASQNPRAKPVSHILTEFVRSDPSGSEEFTNAISLEEFIESESAVDPVRCQVQLARILTLLMLSLQAAQDKLKFVHWDLHLGNVLLHRFNKPKRFEFRYSKEVFGFDLMYFPYIIDFGRAHVNTKNINESTVFGIEHQKLVDVEFAKVYKKYNDFHNVKWPIDSWKSFAVVGDMKRETFRRIARLWMKSETDPVLFKYFDTYKIQKISDILVTFYKADLDLNLYYYIDPHEFSAQYDMYRLLMSVFRTLKETSERGSFRISDAFTQLFTDLAEAYPFCIEDSVLSSNYKSVTNKFNKPIELAVALAKFDSL